jgi:hypothetical protein
MKSRLCAVVVPDEGESTLYIIENPEKDTFDNINGNLVEVYRISEVIYRKEGPLCECCARSAVSE